MIYLIAAFLVITLFIINTGIMLNKLEKNSNKKKKLFIVRKNNQLIYYKHVINEKNFYISNSVKVLLFQKIRNILTELINSQDDEITIKQYKIDIKKIDHKVLEYSDNSYSNPIELFDPDNIGIELIDQKISMYEKLKKILNMSLKKKEVTLDFFNTEVEKIEYCIFITKFKEKVIESENYQEEEKNKLRESIQQHYDYKKLHRMVYAETKFNSFQSQIR